MTKAIKLLPIFIAIILMMSFTSGNNNDYVGTYGDSGSSSSQIRLTISSDRTFHYQDFSKPDNKIVANGSWISKGKNVILIPKGPMRNFHNIWTFEENGQVVVSRNGQSIYSLRKIDG